MTQIKVLEVKSAMSQWQWDEVGVNLERPGRALTLPCSRVAKGEKYCKMKNILDGINGRLNLA